MFGHSSELGNAHAHAVFDHATVGNPAPGTPARSFDAYEVLFAGQPIAVGEVREACAGVTVTRRC